eukprot:CAMPEP_0197400926 /NCGR_PEP_ID=MMETSP1165-20131217/17648_1 /TAXON_ID=284809 /ORGANISM="Chrysocystis fragilis, Strain CCMP3189" /LENGTH=69 /DNA_ID=CAMNT_0042927015 /DNA_START=288 /DNA_END=497 /DNA_ORIENTATION=+
MFETFLRDDLGVANPDAFVERLRDSSGPGDDVVLRATLACLDYETFCEAMRDHERESKMADETAADLGL